MTFLAIACATVCFGSGCAAESEETSSADSAVTIFSSSTARKGPSFVNVEAGDQIVGAVGDVRAAALVDFGIASLGAYVLHRASGEELGVVTAFDTEGKPRGEILTNMKDGTTGFVATDDLWTRLGDAKSDARSAFASALQTDLRSMHAGLPADGALGPRSLGALHPQGLAAELSSCGGRLVTGLVESLVGGGVAAGSGYVGISAMVWGAIAPMDLTVAGYGIIAGFVGFVGGVGLAIVGVVTLTAGVVYCATTE